jgi:hypothetical protein
MAITPLPPAPEPTDSTGQFNTKAFAWVASLDTWTTEANALQTNVNALEAATASSASQAASSATQASGFADTALSHAQAAAANTNAPLWVSGTTYAAGALVYSPSTGKTYRRRTAGAGTTDPSLDAANWLLLQNDIAVQSFSYDSATTTPNSIFGQQRIVAGVHDKMRGCVLNADGTVNYYLLETDWAFKSDGTASDLTGADGNVMVEIPKFYYRIERTGTISTWRISAFPQAGFNTHPAFIKDGVEVDYRYYSAYDGCVLDLSSSPQEYVSGLNWDNNSGANGVGIDVTASTGDKLASVKGVYPMTGLTRNEFRTLAANVGTGWRQVDFTLWSAVQMLYVVEYQTFNSQSVLGAGNTNGSYFTASGNQTDSPHTIAGAGDAIANGSTNTTSGAGVNAKPGTSFMKYRGIENFYGNIWNWADGINVNVTSNGNVHVTNNRADFADNTSTNMALIATALPTASGFIRDLLPADPYFLSSNNVGGGSASYITDQHFASTSSNRVVLVGGNASDGANAGAFSLLSGTDSGNRNRNRGGRLAY